MAAIALAAAGDDRREFDAFVAGRREPNDVLRARQAAFARAQSLGLPSPQQESWRFTDVGALARTEFRRANDTPVDAGRLPVLSDAGHRLAFVNGRFAPSLSRLRELPARALVASLGQALLTHPEQVVPYLEQLPGLEDNPFVARNGAFWEDGAFIYLPRGAALEQPLQLAFFTTGDEVASYPRNLLILEDDTQAEIVLDYRGEGRYLHCPVTEIHLGAGASLGCGVFQREADHGWHLEGLRLRQARDSRFRGHIVAAGGQLTRTDGYVLLDGEGAECQLYGLTLVKERQLGDQHLWVEHARPRCVSRQLFKNVLQGQGRTVFDGMVHVHPRAQKTDAAQKNQNLLLSRQALAHSNPRLEILADDVKCSHGSTTGFLDPDALFYLRARGLGQAEAQAMLVYAFANEIAGTIQWAPLRERLEQLLRERLYPAAERII